MAKLSILKASTDVTVYVFIQDSSVTTGAGKTGLAYNTASLVCYYVRPLASAAALTLATQTVTGAHSDGGFVEVDATNMPGLYRLDLSDAICATGVNSVVVMLKGAANMAPVTLEIQLTSYNPNDAVRLGLTSLPNAAADAAGGLIISDAGGLDADAQLVTKINDILTDTGTTLQAEVDGIQADTEDIQTRLPAALVSGRIDSSVGAMEANVLTATAINADAITAAKLAADVTTELQSGLATAASLSTVAGYLDTEIAAIITTLGTPAGASISADIAAIEAQTDDIGVAGAGLTALATQTSVNTIDDLLDTEIPALTAALNGLVLVSGTIGATGNDTTHLHLSGLAYADDGINSMLITIKDVSTGLFYSRWIEDFANTGDLATVATLPFTPEASVDLYWITPVRADVTGGSGLDAAGVRAAIGLASANLDTQLGAIDDLIDTEVAAIKSDTAAILADTGTDGVIVASLAAGSITASVVATGAIDADAIAADAVTEIQSGLATAANLSTVAGYLDTEIAAILADTNELQTDWANGGRLDLLIDAILEDTGTTLDDLIDDIESRLTAARAGYLDNLSAGAVATAASVAALNDLSAAQVNAEVVDALITDVIADSVATDGSRPTIAQALLLMYRFLLERSVSGTTLTVKKEDGSTTSATFTLNDATSPTSITRAS